MEPKNIAISKLLLDSKNPRHETIENQREIISELLENGKVLRLARDIAEQNGLSPLDIIGVIERNNEYIVVEGNRRTCAYQLLHNPELCSDKNIKKRLKSYAKNATLPNKVTCAIFASREEADPWIKRRHGGAQDGVGTINWSPQQTARYDDRQGNTNKNIQAQRLLDYAIQEGIITDEERTDYSVTTLQRYLGNPVFRNALGLINALDLTTRHSKEHFDQFIVRFLHDTIPDEHGNAVVHSRTKSVDWQNYANTLSSEITAPPTQETAPQNYSKPEKKEPGQQEEEVKKERQETDPKKKTRSKPDPTKRKYIFPADTSFTINDLILQRIYQELKKLEIEGFEFCIAFLIRAFIEKTALLYLKKYCHNKTQAESKLNKKFQWIKDDLEEKDILSKELTTTLSTLISDKNSLLSPFMMGATIHATTIPNKRELINIWDKLEPLVRFLLEQTQQKGVAE